MNIDNLISSVPASGSTRTSKFRLDSETELELDQFVVWLRQVEGKSVATSQSYRSYVAKALFLEQSWSEMSSDQRSAVRALARFRTS